MKKKTKVIVGMSGGVDSSVAAALLLEQGHDVTGIFMKNWSVPINGQDVCAWEEDSSDARAVAAKLGIPFYVLSFENEYRKAVVDYMIDEYRAGRTPNPDIMCNSEIKFNLFLKKALSLGADYVATGHYARIFCHPEHVRQAQCKLRERSLDSSTALRFAQNDKSCQLLRGKDANKDQSYFLYRLTQDQLSKILFPIGHLEKTEVRNVAKKLNLPTADKKDSTGVCFIGEFSMKDFLKQEIRPKAGAVVNVETRQKVAVHEGISYYTVGQRHGFGGGGGVPYYVSNKDAKSNTLYVAPGRYHASLFKNEIEIEALHWIQPAGPVVGSSPSRRGFGGPPSPTPPARAQDITAKVRYRGEEYRVEKIIGNKVIFKDAVWAATPGQSIVFYDGDVCLGGAVITASVS